ncbi:MAG: class I SAM-dependent methyltransferase [Bacteroidetes bacterium]|nr:class I SAM-dependent methyltransferase [Bacteroidota bacterium]
MIPHLNTGMLHELYQRRQSFPLDEDILGRLNSSTPSPETLQFLGMLVLWKQPRHIFEFGCGPSTLFLSRLQHRLGATNRPVLTTVDHSQRYLGETRRLIGGDPDVCLLHAPLAVTECAGRVFTTYHPSYLRQVPRDVRFDVVLIDGPPAYRYGREAPLYHLAPFLTPDALIILDDANCRPEQEALKNWQIAWPDGFCVEQFPGLPQGMAVLTIGESMTSLQPVARPDQRAGDLERIKTFLSTEGGIFADGH